MWKKLLLICCFMDLWHNESCLSRKFSCLNTNGTIVTAGENKLVVQGTGNISNVEAHFAW